MNPEPNEQAVEKEASPAKEAAEPKKMSDLQPEKDPMGAARPFNNKNPELSK